MPPEALEAKPSAGKASEVKASSPSGELFRSTLLDNGMRVLSEPMDAVRSVAVGVWVRRGAVHDPPAFGGIGHLLEHMVFKGTEARSAREIALSLESVGGALDAYTAREHTCFLARVPARHLPMAMDVLADLVQRPVLRGEDLEREKEVVAEEIAAVEDTPDDLVFELHSEQFWRGHPYGRPILGTRDAVAAVEPEDLRRQHESWRSGANLVLAAAGRVSGDVLLELAGERFGHVPRGVCSNTAEPPPQPERTMRWVEREGAQVHVVAAWPGPARADLDRHPALLLSMALGGGMSSRLFQRIREDLALAYSVHSFQSAYARGGAMGVYLATRPKCADAALDALNEVCGEILSDGLSADELQAAKEQVKGHLLLSLESPGARIGRLADLALHDLPLASLDELEQRIDRVAADDVLRVAQSVFRPGRQNVLCLGPRRRAATISPNPSSQRTQPCSSAYPRK